MNLVFDNSKPKYANSPDIVSDLLSTYLKNADETDQQKEHFFVLCLNRRNRVTNIELITLGTLSETLIHPREVFKIAILRNSANIIIAHNHPSEETDPSEQDLKITKRLKEAGKLIGIDVLDHVIFTINNNYLSFKESYLI